MANKEVSINEEQLAEIPRGQRFQYLIEQGVEVKAARAAIEKLRGVKRDAEGKIKWTKAQINERIKHFKAKIEDFDNRKENAEKEVSRLEEMKGNL